jgi:hypothetical protein
MGFDDVLPKAYTPRTLADMGNRMVSRAVAYPTSIQ